MTLKDIFPLFCHVIQESGFSEWKLFSLRLNWMELFCMRFDLIFLRVIIARMCKFKVLMDAIYAGGLLINFFFFWAAL